MFTVIDQSSHFSEIFMKESVDSSTYSNSIIAKCCCKIFSFIFLSHILMEK